MLGRNAIFIKELTLKSENAKNLADVHAKIKEAIRLIKQKDSQEIRPADAREEDQHLAHEELVKARSSTAKMPTLHDLIVRPAITGKKTIGVLECHSNGFRFNSSKGQKVDLTFNNIRNAFFQPCEETDIIVLIHFRLKAPILIGQKKYLDIQFYAEVCNQFEDIDRKGKVRLTEQDEIQ